LHIYSQTQRANIFSLIFRTLYAAVENKNAFIKTHSKNKNISPLKIYFAPLSNLKTCLRVCWRLLSFVTQRSKTKITTFRCYACKQPRRCNCFITLSALRKSTARMVKWNLHKSDQCPIDLNSLQLAPRIYSANIG